MFVRLSFLKVCQMQHPELQRGIVRGGFIELCSKHTDSCSVPASIAQSLFTHTHLYDETGVDKERWTSHQNENSLFLVQGCCVNSTPAVHL